MNKKDSYITDTDFIPSYIKEGDDADLVYGILQHYHYYIDGKVEYVYNLVCCLCEKQKTLILKRIRAKQWIKLLEGIINKLGNFQNKQESEIHYYLEVPYLEIFFGYTDVILQSYEFARSVLSELLEADFNDVELIELENDAYPVKSLKELFFTFKNKVEDGALEWTDRYTFTSEMVFDEMLRRELIFSCDEQLKDYDYDVEEANRYKEHLLGGKIKKPNYVQIEVVDDAANEKITIQTTALELVGTLYYMLYKDIDANIIVKAASYVQGVTWCGNKDEKKPAAYYYIHSPQRFLVKDVPNNIAENLKKYNIEVPKVLQDYIKK